MFITNCVVGYLYQVAFGVGKIDLLLHSACGIFADAGTFVLALLSIEGVAEGDVEAMDVGAIAPVYGIINLDL